MKKETTTYWVLYDPQNDQFFCSYDAAYGITFNGDAEYAATYLTKDQTIRVMNHLLEDAKYNLSNEDTLEIIGREPLEEELATVKRLEPRKLKLEISTTYRLEC